MEATETHEQGESNPSRVRADSYNRAHRLQLKRSRHADRYTQSDRAERNRSSGRGNNCTHTAGSCFNSSYAILFTRISNHFARGIRKQASGRI